MSSSIDEWTNDAQTSPGKTARYRFTLYVVGTTPRTGRAIVNLRQLFEEYLPGRYQLDIVDVGQHPQIAVREQVVAVPMLIKEEPTPARRFIGDMSDTQRLLRGLELN